MSVFHEIIRALHSDNVISYGRLIPAKTSVSAVDDQQTVVVKLSTFSQSMIQLTTREITSSEPRQSQVSGMSIPTTTRRRPMLFYSLPTLPTLWSYVSSENFDFLCFHESTIFHTPRLGLSSGLRTREA